MTAPVAQVCFRRQPEYRTAARALRLASERITQYESIYEVPDDWPKDAEHTDAVLAGLLREAAKT